MARLCIAAAYNNRGNAYKTKGDHDRAIADYTEAISLDDPCKLNPEQLALVARLADEGQSAPQIAETFGVHETTIYRCLNALEGTTHRAA